MVKWLLVILAVQKAYIILLNVANWYLTLLFYLLILIISTLVCSVKSLMVYCPASSSFLPIADSREMAFATFRIQFVLVLRYLRIVF